MRADQAIYTSLARAGQAGYHVVGRSRGVSDADARALASWCPSHDALIVDEANRASVNVHPLPEGRLAVSRTCEGPPEYSGRGGRQIYTHAMILSATDLERSGTQPIALYRDAMALGLLRYRHSPATSLDEIELGRWHPPVGTISAGGPPPDLGPIDLAAYRARLDSGESIEIRFSGDRVRLAEWLLDGAGRGLAASLSVSTSLRPSSSRPFRIRIVP